MTWSDTTYSIATGDWKTTSTWTGGAVPSIDDYVELHHPVTIDYTATALCAGLFATKVAYTPGGKLVMGPDAWLTVKDTAGTHPDGEHVKFDMDGQFESTATYAYPAHIKSQTTTPAYRIKMSFAQVADYDARLLKFDYVELRDSVVYLGDGATNLYFNTGTPTDGILGMPSPVKRDQVFSNRPIYARNYGRVRRKGGHAGTLTLQGVVPWAGFKWKALETIRDSGYRVGLATQFVTVPRARIEDLSPGRRDGIWLPFTLTLVEDL